MKQELHPSQMTTDKQVIQLKQAVLQAQKEMTRSFAVFKLRKEIELQPSRY